MFGRTFPLILSQRIVEYTGRRKEELVKGPIESAFERSEHGLHNCFCVTLFYPQNGTAAFKFLYFSTKEALSSKTQTKDFHEIASKMYFSALPHTACFLETRAQWHHATLSHKIIQISGSWYNRMNYNIVIKTDHCRHHKTKIIYLILYDVK